MNGASYLSRESSNGKIFELEYESDSDSDEGSNDESQMVGVSEGESKFGNTELEELVLAKGPRQILQLTLQDKAAEFMKEEVTDGDDYVDWI
jgi:hypothetical protein